MRDYVMFIFGKKAYVRIAAESKNEAYRIFLRAYGWDAAGKLMTDKEFEEGYNNEKYTCEACLNEEARLASLLKRGII